MTDAKFVEKSQHVISAMPNDTVCYALGVMAPQQDTSQKEQVILEAATRIQSLTADLERAKEGLEDALKCTPFVFEGQIGFDGGDPYDVIRRTLKDISHD